MRRAAMVVEQQQSRSIDVAKVGPTHLEVRGDRLPVRPGLIIKIDLEDEIVRMTVSVEVESLSETGFVGRYVEPSAFFTSWATILSQS